MLKDTYWKKNKELAKELELKKQIALLKNELLKKEKEVKQLTRVDFVTKAYNRKTIFRKLEKEFARAQRYKLDFSIIIIDIACPKSDDDALGITSNALLKDTILRDVASEINQLIRFIDILGKYQDNEFLVIFPETELKDAKVISQRILEKIGGMPLVERANISVGLSSFNKESTFNDLLIHTMDKLSLAKKNSKNSLEF